MSDSNMAFGPFTPLVTAFATARSIFTKLPRPARVLIVGTISAAVLLGGFLALQQANESYTPLFTQLDWEDAASIAAKLKEQKVSYRIAADGSSIEVPEAKARELRLELASAGLPRGGGVGFESFDKMRLGATDFEQRVLFKRALEGELTRTIDSLGGGRIVARSHRVARKVRLRVSRRTGVGFGRAATSTGSNPRWLRGRQCGAPGSLGGAWARSGPHIRRHHRRSDAATTAQDVGRGEASANTNDEDSRSAARAYESALEDRVRGMLERVVGPGHADVRVTADVDPARVERVEERFDPSKSVLRSEEQSVERVSNDAENSVAGIPGAESNLPSGALKGSAPTAAASASATPSASAPTAASGAPSAMASASPLRESHTRNYEVDHISEKRVVGAGAVRRLNVAVVLDGVKTASGVVPRSREEIEKLTGLVRSASGVSDARGDVVALESMPFAIEPIDPQRTCRRSILPRRRFECCAVWGLPSEGSSFSWPSLRARSDVASASWASPGEISISGATPRR